MLFTFKVTAPANTSKTAPAKQTMKLRAGVVTRVQVLIPPGHAALAHLGVFHGETMIMPWGEDQWIEGDNERLEWAPDYALTSEPAALEARAWNEDDTYAHSFYVRVWIEPAVVKPDWDLIHEAARALSKFVRRVLGE